MIGVYAGHGWGGASVALSIVTGNSDLERLDGILLEFNYCQPLMHFISNLFSQQDLIKLENWRIKSVKKIFIHKDFMMNLKVICVRGSGKLMIPSARDLDE